MIRLVSKKSAQSGVINPILIIGVVIVAVIALLLATGALKFSASIKPTSGKPSESTQQPQQTTPAKPKTYQNDKNGISLEYPASWSLKENPSATYIAAFFSPKESSSDNYTEFLGLKVVDTSSKPNVTLQELADLWENQTKKAETTFVVIDRKSSTVAGESAKDIIYSGKFDNLEGKGMVRIVLKNSKTYIFQYNAEKNSYDKFLPDIEAILSSVKF